MGFAPIQLALDLRGGVQFLLEVDMEPVYHAQAQSMVDEVTSQCVMHAVKWSTTRFSLISVPTPISKKHKSRFKKSSTLATRDRSDKSPTLTQS